MNTCVWMHVHKCMCVWMHVCMNASAYERVCVWVCAWKCARRNAAIPYLSCCSALHNFSSLLDFALASFKSVSPFSFSLVTFSNCVLLDSQRPFHIWISFSSFFIFFVICAISDLKLLNTWITDEETKGLYSSVHEDTDMMEQSFGMSWKGLLNLISWI